MLPRRYATCHGIQPYRTSYIITLWLLSQNNEAVCYCQPIATEFSLAIFQRFWCHAKLFNHIQLNAIRFSRFAHLFESHKWCEFGQSCTNKSWLKKYRVFMFWSWMVRGDHLKIRIGCFWIFLGFFPLLAVFFSFFQTVSTFSRFFVFPTASTFFRFFLLFFFFFILFACFVFLCLPSLAFSGFPSNTIFCHFDFFPRILRIFSPSPHFIVFCFNHEFSMIF